MVASLEHNLSDGCTGYGLFEWIWPAIRDCCAVHDYGGTDGQLLDCLQSALPGWAWAPAALCVALMILLRPIYRLFKPKGSAKL